MFGVSFVTIGEVRRGKSYKHVKDHASAPAMHSQPPTSGCTHRRTAHLNHHRFRPIKRAASRSATPRPEAQGFERARSWTECWRMDDGVFVHEGRYTRRAGYRVKFDYSPTGILLALIRFCV